MRMLCAAGLAAAAGAALTVGAGPAQRGGGEGTAAPGSGAPLAFERNDGQCDPRVAFVARPRGVTLFVEPAAATFAWPDAAIRMRAVGADGCERAFGSGELPGKVNYLRGRDPGKWITGVPTFARVETPSIYPGIVLAWYGSGRHAEYDFEVEPGADPSRIELAFEGAESIAVEESGDLVARVGRHELRQTRPSVHEVRDGVRRPLEGRFVLREDRLVAFEVAGRDPSARLVIDPLAIAWSDFLGGSGRDACVDVAVDGSRNPIVTGDTPSLDFPTTPGAFDATSVDEVSDVFVTKFRADGSAHLWSTYLGGSGGDQARAIAVSAAGVVTVCGVTYSEDFPVDGFDETIDDVPNSGNGADGFVTRLDADGAALVWSTFLGGTDGQEEANDVVVDAAGLAHVTGWTSSSDFPVSVGALQTAPASGALEAFFTVIAADGRSYEYSTYVGGSASDEGHGIARDSDGNVFIVGAVESFADPPVSFTGTAAIRPYAGGRDLFVVKITSQRTWSYMTFLGGQLDELPTSGTEVFPARIALDGVGHAFVCGNTNSSDFPVGAADSSQNEGTQDAIVAKLSPAGALLWARYFGTNAVTGEGATAVEVDDQGRPHVCGFTQHGTGIPIVDATQPNPGGAQDAWYAVFKADGTGIDRSTYLGGSDDELALGLALPGDGSVYVAGHTSSTTGLGRFPIVGGVQKLAAGDPDDGYPREGFVTKYTPGQGGEVRKFQVMAGKITDSTKFFKDKAAFGGTLPVPADFDPRPLPLNLRIFYTPGEMSGDLDVYDIPADDPRWKSKKGKYTFRFDIDDGIHVTLVVDPRKGVFAYSAKSFSFTFPFANPVKVQLSFGPQFAFETTQTWTQKGTKFTLP